MGDLAALFVTLPPFLDSVFFFVIPKGVGARAR